MAIRERNKSKRREEGEGSPRGTGAGAGMARQLPGVDWGVWRAPQLYCLSHGALVMVDPQAPSTPPPLLHPRPWAGARLSHEHPRDTCLEKLPR